jgi:hypothetical protein
MGIRRVLEDSGKVKKLADQLGKCPQVQALDEGEEKEAWTLAHSFSDIEESFLTILDGQLSRLLESELEASEVYDLLLDIGEEFRHILYHINDPKFYRYLQKQCNEEGHPIT